MIFLFIYMGVLSIIVITLLTYQVESMHVPKVDASMRPSTEGINYVQTSNGEYSHDQYLNTTHNFTNYSSFAEFEERQQSASVAAATKKPSNINLINLLPSRITEKLLKHFFSLFFSDPDILKSCAKVGSWVLWSFICLSLLGMTRLYINELLVVSYIAMCII